MEIVGEWRRLAAAAAAAGERGTVGVAVLGPDSAAWQQWGERQFSAASTVKIPIMVEVYRQIEAGRLRLEDRHLLSEVDRSPGSGVLLHLHAGIELTLADLLYLMISISDNTATNLLIRLAGMERINETMRRLGMTRSNLGREMKGRPILAGEVDNLATPVDYARAVAAILDGAAAGVDSCAAMAALLEKQQNARRIGRYVPTGAAVRWGSKTGSITGVTNDVGFVSGPNGRLIIAVFCENLADQHAGEAAIGAIARAALADSGVVGPLYTS